MRLTQYIREIEEFKLSKELNDLLPKIKSNCKPWLNKIKSHRETLHSCDPENSFLIYETNKRNEKLLKVIKGYTNKNLSAGTDADVEIMIKCKEYFLVDSGNAPLIKELEKLF